MGVRLLPHSGRIIRAAEIEEICDAVNAYAADRRRKASSASFGIETVPDIFPEDASSIDRTIYVNADEVHGGDAGAPTWVSVVGCLRYSSASGEVIGETPIAYDLFAIKDCDDILGVDLATYDNARTFNSRHGWATHGEETSLCLTTIPHLAIGLR
jgi:hypothetical protein